jgi:hypothetical protein
MNRSRSRRLIGLVVLALAGCLDTAEPTGPVPTPEPDPGELTAGASLSAGDVPVSARPGHQAASSAPVGGS